MPHWGVKQDRVKNRYRGQKMGEGCHAFGEAHALA